jgi:hypothetical protein
MRAAVFVVSPIAEYADLGGEHVAAIDAQLQRQGGARIGQPPQRPQHPPLVVLARLRHAGSHEEFAAVLVDVDGEQRDVLGLEDALCGADGCIERACDGVGALAFQ